MEENILILFSDSCPREWVMELKSNLEKVTGSNVQTEHFSDTSPPVKRIPARWSKGRYSSGSRQDAPLNGHPTRPEGIRQPGLILDLGGRKPAMTFYSGCPILSCSLFDEATGPLHAVVLKAIAGNSPTLHIDIRLHQENQQPRVIKRGCFKTLIYDYRKTLDVILENLIVLIPSAVQQLDLTGQRTGLNNKKADTNWQMLVDECSKNEKHHRLMHRARLFFTSETWNTGFLPFPIEKVALERKTKWEVEWDEELPAGSFRADAFGIEEDGQRMVIYEKYSRNTGRLVMEHDGKSTEPLPEHDIHRSYPFLFRHKEVWYCLPEQKALKKLSLYRIDKKFHRLVHVCDIINDIEAADPSMIFLHDRWWLFFTDTTHKGADLRLCIFHSMRPEGPWTPHALNPVKTDITCARPAGHLFLHKGIAYRPAQDSSLTYGGSIRIHRIDELTPEVFRESEVNHLLPDQLNGPYQSGWHTLSICGNGCLVDGKRSFTDPMKILRKIRLKS